MVIFRLSRSWNQTGNKWFASPDIGKYLNQSQNTTLLSLLTFLAFTMTISFTYAVQRSLCSISNFVGIFVSFFAYTSLCLIGVKYFPKTFQNTLPIFFQNFLYVARLTYLCIGIVGFWALFGLPLFVWWTKKSITLVQLLTNSVLLLLLAFHLLAFLLHKQHNLLLLVLFLVEICLLWKIFNSYQSMFPS
jgi:hypothetical protein